MASPLSPSIQSRLDTAEADFLMADHLTVPRNWGAKRGPHALDFCKLYYIEKGRGRIVLAGRELLPRSGDMVLLPQGGNHSYSVPRGLPPFQKYYCHFALVRGGAGLFRSLKIQPVLTPSPRDRERVISRFRELMELNSSPEPGRRLRQKALTMELFGIYLKNAAIEEMDESRRMGDLIRYMEDHLNEKLDLKILANQVNLEKSYFVRLFHRSMGMPPMQYVNRRRLEKACRLLLQTDLSVTETAEHCGFATVYYFSQYFKSRYGLSPRDYRNQVRRSPPLRKGRPNPASGL